jgi:hypothetical protein
MGATSETRGQTQEWWIRQTTSLLKQRRSWQTWIVVSECEANRRGDLEWLARIRVDAARHEHQYLKDVLAAWRAHRPQGLLVGEVLPNEVHRAMSSASCSFSPAVKASI